MKYGELIDPVFFLDKELFIWKKPGIDRLLSSLETTEIIGFELEHLTGLPAGNLHLWVVVENLGYERKDRNVWLVKGWIHSSVPHLHEDPQRYSFEGRLDYTSPAAASYLKIIE